VQAFIQVLLPQLMPGIAAGCLLAFVLSLDDFLIASFTAGSGATLPMEIFSRIRTGSPDINALSVILILVSGLVAFVAEYIRYQTSRILPSKKGRCSPIQSRNQILECLGAFMV